MRNYSKYIVFLSTASPVAQLVFLNSPGMVLVVGGKLVAAILTGDEIEKIRMVRFHRRPNGVQAWTGNWTGGKSKMFVGVVRGVNR
jgi:hypothetical protein